MSVHYETDDVAFPAEAYAVRGYRGVAFAVLGWETEPDDATEWSGMEERTGRVVVVMIGDDRRHVVDLSDLSPLAADDYCAECGQVGCRHSFAS